MLLGSCMDGLGYGLVYSTARQKRSRQVFMAEFTC